MRAFTLPRITERHGEVDLFPRLYEVLRGDAEAEAEHDVETAHDTGHPLLGAIAVFLIFTRKNGPCRT